MISHKKEFGVYHWDTFDNVTLLIKDCKTLQEALDFVGKKYGDRISSQGADQVDIVNSKGDIVRKIFSKMISNKFNSNH